MTIESIIYAATNFKDVYKVKKHGYELYKFFSDIPVDSLPDSQQIIEKSA